MPLSFVTVSRSSVSVVPLPGEGDEGWHGADDPDTLWWDSRTWDPVSYGAAGVQGYAYYPGAAVRLGRRLLPSADPGGSALPPPLNPQLLAQLFELMGWDVDRVVVHAAWTDGPVFWAVCSSGLGYDLGAHVCGTCGRPGCWYSALED